MKKIFDAMIFNNKWLWTHMLGGLIAGKVALLIHMPAFLAIGVVLLVALLWGVYEWRIEDQEEIYGSKANAIFDALGDIIGAVICCVLVVL